MYTMHESVRIYYMYVHSMYVCLHRRRSALIIQIIRSTSSDRERL